MQHPRHRHRIPDRQPALFLASRAPVTDPAPGWNALPDRTRHAVTNLMTRLLVAHADEASQRGSDGDER